MERDIIIGAISEIKVECRWDPSKIGFDLKYCC